MDFADRMKYYRNAINVTQGELAKKMDVKQSTVSSWERGRTDPTVSQIRELCYIFGCSMAELTDTPERKVGEITKEDIMVKINNMSMSELEELQNIVHRRIQEMERLVDLERGDEGWGGRLERQMNEMKARLMQLEDEKNKVSGKSTKRN